MNNTISTSNGIIIGLLVALLIGGYLYYQHDENTATIELPGDQKVEIQE